MGFRRILDDQSSRTRLLGVAFALGVFASLPAPSPGMDSAWNFLMTSLWFVVGAFGWSVWFRPAWAQMLWGGSLVLAFIAWKSKSEFLPFGLLAAWGAWFHLRRVRESRSLGFAVILLVGAWGSVNARATDPMTPKYLSGNALNDLSSCAAVDQIPWKFAPNGRKTRLLLRDRLRLNTEAKFAVWEINQVMDREGYVTYVFTKIDNGKTVEALAIKDNVFNRFEPHRSKMKVVEVQDLRTLINRTVVGFTHEDTSTIDFAPGLAGQSRLSIELRQAAGGRPLPPIYVRGSYCDRPTGDTNAPAEAAKADAAPAAAAAPATGTPK